MKVKIRHKSSGDWHTATVPDKYVGSVLDTINKRDGSGDRFCGETSSGYCERCGFFNPDIGGCGARLISVETPIGSRNARSLYFKRVTAKVRLNV